ncbi:acyltransferase [Terrabacter sp. LjRoot27]|uniref:acyltransferase n=1 Tax=Terrabacter sp. LjRoot27 TaxID=3342306 RepID=UPI003ED03DF1
MIKGHATVGLFASRGDHFDFDPDGYYSYENIHVGHHVNLGTRPTLLATRAQIRIGNHVLFGPGVTIRGGNHRIDVQGVYLDQVDESMKRPDDDLGVVIEDDVWVGGNATILHGVTVGRGSVIGASAVVVRNVPPYSVVVGSPARVVRRRWDSACDASHERQLEQGGGAPPVLTGDDDRPAGPRRC